MIHCKAVADLEGIRGFNPRFVCPKYLNILRFICCFNLDFTLKKLKTNIDLLM